MYSSYLAPQIGRMYLKICTILYISIRFILEMQRLEIVLCNMHLEMYWCPTSNSIYKHNMKIYWGDAIILYASIFSTTSFIFSKWMCSTIIYVMSLQNRVIQLQWYIWLRWSFVVNTGTSIMYQFLKRIERSVIKKSQTIIWLTNHVDDKSKRRKIWS